jgi:hypothetical protein
MKLKMAIIITGTICNVLLTACTAEHSTDAPQQKEMVLMEKEGNLIPTHLYTIPAQP